MRFLKFSLFLAGLTLLCITNTYSQSVREYVVLKSGDTIYCKIKTTLFGLKTYSVNDSTAIKITPDEVREYRFRKDKNPFVSKTLPNGKVEFLAFLEDGKVNLYEMLIKGSAPTMGAMGAMGAMATSTRYFYAQKSGVDSVLLIKSSSLINKNSPKERRTIFSELIADDPELLKFFKSKDDYSFEEIRNTIKLYNKRSLTTK